MDPTGYDVVISSADRDSGSTSDYVVHLPSGPSLDEYDTFYCSSVSMRGSQYTVGPHNNTLRLSILLNSSVYGILPPTTPTVVAPFSVQLPEGNYLPEDITTLLPGLIESSYVDTFPTLAQDFPLHSQVVFDPVTQKFTVYFLSVIEYVDNPAVGPNLSPAYFGAVIHYKLHTWDTVENKTAHVVGVVVVGDGITTNNSLNFLMGFNTPVGSLLPPQAFLAGYSPSGVTWVSDTPHKMYTKQALLLNCDLCTDLSVTTFRQVDVRQNLCVVATPPYGSFGYWDALQPSRKPVSRRKIVSIRFYWLDQYGNPVYFTNDHLITLKFEKSTKSAFQGPEVY